MQVVKAIKLQPPLPKGIKFLKEGDKSPEAKALVGDPFSILYSILDWLASVKLEGHTCLPGGEGGKVSPTRHVPAL